MSNNQPNPRHVEILAEEAKKFDSKDISDIKRRIETNVERIWSGTALTAMQRAVEEAENSLIAKYQNMEDELEQLRSELERVRAEYNELALCINMLNYAIDNYWNAKHRGDAEVKKICSWQQASLKYLDKHLQRKINPQKTEGGGDD